MSTVTLSDVKDFLNVPHTSDDAKLQILIDASEDEALKFMNRTTFGSTCEEDSTWDSTGETIPDVVVAAIYFLVQAKYDATPEQIDTLRIAAHNLMMPYRCAMGM